MFEMQESLQNAIGAKRGTICPNTWQKKDVDDIYRVMAKESGYYMMSTITELFEMFEQIEDAFGFNPVKIGYTPKGVKYVEGQIDEDIYHAMLLYGNKEETKISSELLLSCSMHQDIEFGLISKTIKKILEVNYEML